MIGTGRTTLAILEVAAIEPDDVVVVTGAAGGIGSLLVQAGGEGRRHCRGPGRRSRRRSSGSADLGADVAVDYDAADWTAAVRDALGDRVPTVALDGVGGAAGRGAFELLGPGGRLILFGWSSGKPLAFEVTELFDRSLTVSAAIGPRIFQRPGGMRSLETEALAAPRRRTSRSRRRPAVPARRRRRCPPGHGDESDLREDRPRALTRGMLAGCRRGSVRSAGASSAARARAMSARRRWRWRSTSRRARRTSVRSSRPCSPCSTRPSDRSMSSRSRSGCS